MISKTGPLAIYEQQELDHILAHKARVKEAYNFFKDIGFIDKCKKFMTFNESTLDKLIETHDDSKLCEPEFSCYRQWWYPAPWERRSKVKLNTGLIHHLNTNPHHFQYYITYETKYNDGEKILKMPNEYILEMLCDWYSFSIKDNNLFGIFDWWEKENNKMILNTTTRNTIETCLSRLKTLLNKEVDKYNEGRIKNENN